MPVTKSAKKALRQSIKRRARNLRRKNKIKTLTKEIKRLVEKKELEKAKQLLPQLYKALDKAAKAGTIKKNTASRKKSRITIFLNKAIQSLSQVSNKEN